ncbi:MAG: hypothetical protein FJ086_04880 [Deltaproteobacteria bacterium]|nr:hypothetical protein [Deltaproteobacteria bacterium]
MESARAALLVLTLAWGLLSHAAVAGGYAVTELPAPADAGGDAAACVESARAALAAQKVRVDDPEVAAAVARACAPGAKGLLLVLPRKLPDPAVAVSLTGTYQRGNVNTGNLGGTVAFKAQFLAHQVEGMLKGQVLLDSKGQLQHFLDGVVMDDLLLDGRWSLFGLLTSGRDTRKRLAFYVSEMAGVAYGLFDRGGPGQLKLSVGVGHRFEQAETGWTANNRDGFAGNNGILSWRVKGKYSAGGGAVLLSAVVGYQHILYAPPRAEAVARWLDVADYRLLVEGAARVHLATLGPGRELFGNVAVSCDYFAHPVTDVPWDLGVLGGLGVGF